MPEYLQYGAMGLLAIVLVGGGKSLLTMMQNGIERLIDQAKESNRQLADKLNGLEGKLDDHAQDLHNHLSESERRLAAQIEGRKPTPPPMKAYRPGGAE